VRPDRSIRWITVCISLATCMRSSTVASQVYTGASNSHEVFVGTETEQYLRNLSLSDTTTNESWSIRPLSPSQIRRLSHAVNTSVWTARLARFSDSTAAAELRWLSPNVSLRFNSAYPYGSNDAAIWAGRGLTISGQAGFYARLGPLSLTFLPIAFSARNSSFPLAPSRLPCGCGEQLHLDVDRPQRFGTDAYRRLDPGQSSLRFDGVGISAGLSTANEGWGPSIEYPFLLGDNAAGFPHLFVGSASPFPVFVGHAHVKIIYGRLDQSAFSPVTGSKFFTSLSEVGRVRFVSGLIASFQPRGIDGLEVGGARFIHSIWPRTGIPSSYFRKPFQAFLKYHLGPTFDSQLAGTDNQLASLFARWAFAPSGFEVYGEYGREDHSYDLRDFLQEPDHERAYSLGLAKKFGGDKPTFNVFRVELINFQLPPLATTGRGEGTIYGHSPLQQGHTNRGQLLGADVGVGAAAGSTVSWDRYSPSGRWRIFWRRDVRQETGDPSLTAPSISQIADVLHAIGFERLQFTRRFDVTTSVTFMRDLSRNFSNSASNLNAAFSLTLPR
jgi:hypothetical protein